MNTMIIQPGLLILLSFSSVIHLFCLLQQCLTFLEGWATAESALMRLAQMWLGARSLEFTWSFLQMGIEANINLVSTYSFPLPPSPFMIVNDYSSSLI
jgi:Na+/alanine symporter